MIDIPDPWPNDRAGLETLQDLLAGRSTPLWEVPSEVTIGGSFVCFGRGGSGPGAAGDPAWGAAVSMRGVAVVAEAIVEGVAGAPYAPGYLAAREGRVLGQAVGSLTQPPDVLLVNATGTDHPRQAGLAVQVGWALDLPTVGVTDRPLSGEGPEPGPDTGDKTPLRIVQEQVGWRLRTRAGARPVVVSAGWRTDLAVALDVVTMAVRRSRTPEPIRVARRLARTARAQSEE